MAPYKYVTEAAESSDAVATAKSQKRIRPLKVNVPKDVSEL